METLKKLYAHLENGNLAKSFEPEDEDELAFINTLDLLTWNRLSSLPTYPRMIWQMTVLPMNM